MKLPVADTPQVWSHTWSLLSRHRRALTSVGVLNLLASAAGLASPWLLGRLVDAIVDGRGADVLDMTVLALAAAYVVQATLVRGANLRSLLLGEQVFADLREEFIDTVMRLPLSTVERAGTGDLLARTTNDVDRIQHAVRFGVPRLLVCVTTILLALLAAFLTHPLVALALLTGIPVALPFVLWYLRRAKPVYLREGAAYAVINGTLTESVEGARTIDALGLGARRRARLDSAIREAYRAERASLRLRTVLFPGVDVAFMLPAIVALAWGAYLVSTGSATIGAVTTIALYANHLMHPMGELLFWLEVLQTGSASLARIIGVGLVESDREAGVRAPEDEHLRAEGVRYAYREGHDVLHGVDLDLAVGERLAVVGPSGAGKSTLGRMLAGVHPPTAGTVTVGGVPLVELPLDALRGHVALVTQEHHVFVGTVADNLRLARVEADEEMLLDALGAVDARAWVEALPDGLGTTVGSGGAPLSPAQAQQLALARLVLLDPHTLVLDEATSLLDPRAARHLERSLAAVLEGRTVVAIAHRLHTAHDADRVAVVDSGRIVEIGTHDELVAAGGDYAALWQSWQQE